MMVIKDQGPLMFLALYGLLILRTALRGGSCYGTMIDEADEFGIPDQ